MEQKQHKPIPSFNDHSNCKGHANWMLDCTFVKPEDREVLDKVIGNYLAEEK